MKEITITGALEGQRLDRFLNRYLPGASTGFLHKMLRKKNIKLNAGKAEGNEKLKKGDKIQIYFSDETFEKFRGNASDPVADQPKKAEPKARLTREQMDLRRQVKLIYKSGDILVFHKPAGMLTQKAVKSDDSLNDYLLDYCKKNKLVDETSLSVFRPAAANRLDRNTSGMVLCGITIKGLQVLSELLRDRNLKKYYLCIVKGRMEKSQGKIRGYLSKDETSNVVTVTKEKMEGASYIATDYEVLEANHKASLLKIRLITGKSHQIRAHLASIGHPVAGDYKYGERRFNDVLKRELQISYQMLHSYELIFPESEELKNLGIKSLHLKDPMPGEFVKVREYYGLWEHGTQED